jgi:diadenylate cyclase
MTTAFISIRFLDIVDIFLVAFLLYQLYMLIRGTVAIRIFIGIFAIYLFWLLVKAMNMALIGSILGQVIGVGVIALLIVFQQEIRRFLLLLGNRNFINQNIPFLRYFSQSTGVNIQNMDALIQACDSLSKNLEGGLIVISKGTELKTYTATGEILNADISERLILNIFYKNSPLHDGAIIILNNKILAAGCVLPVSNNPELPKELGLRHRAAVGMTENTDTIVIVISEQTGNISVSKNGKIYSMHSLNRLKLFLQKELKQ